MTEFVRALPHPEPGGYASALSLLAASEDIAIAHVDSGIWPHPGLGWTDPDRPPENIRLESGVNFFDPGGPEGDRPLARLRKPGGVAGLIEYPDHGVKTLSALIGTTPSLRGVAPGARIVPYRIANGPLFRAAGSGEMQGPAMPRSSTALIGTAIDHALGLGSPDRVRVITMSMGNPGFMGLFEPVRVALGGEAGLDPAAAAAIDRAYEAGVIVVCAAGQVIDGVIYPAKFSRTIAVGGYDARGGERVHYPRGGYRDDDWDDLVDVWAQAERINRAGYDASGPSPRPIFADELDQGEPSGTSYATPQVAGAAALWVASHARELEEAYGAKKDRWKIVESFRAALRASADEKPSLLRPFAGSEVRQIRTLNIRRLLTRGPSADATLKKATKAAKQGML